MSLQVWLPLTGTLNNQGLSRNIDFTATGTITDNNNGKIGKCKTFSLSNYIGDYSYDLEDEFSICLWVKWDALPSSSSNDWLCEIASTSGYENGVIGLSCYHTKFLCVMAGGKYDYSYSLNPVIDTWYHIAFTWNNNDDAKLYINGALVKTYSNLKNGTKTSASKISLGSNVANSSTKFTGSLNDFRFYNHCLSLKEVEEISKGLVLHYKLDQNLNTLDNCYNYPTFQTASTNGGWSHWGASGHAGTYGQNTDKEYIFRNNQSYSHWVANGDTATATYLIYQSPAFSGGFRSLQAIIKEESGQQITENICVPAWNARNGGVPANKWTSINYLGDGFYSCKCEGISQDGSNNLIGMHIKPGYKIYISEMYCENDREICSDIFSQNNLTTIYDSSGYNNNGTITGSLQVDTDSSRYNYCTYMADGNASYITTPTLNLPGDQITMNFWFKSSNKSPTGGYHQPLCSTSGGRYEISITSAGTFRGGLYIDESRKVDNGTSSKLTDGNWHMCTITYDGTTIKRYVDAISEKDTSVSGALNTAQSFVIGHYGSNTSYASKEVYESDVRIYTTALTPAQIEELYHTSASIDNNGNIYAREIIES